MPLVPYVRDRKPAVTLQCTNLQAEPLHPPLRTIYCAGTKAQHKGKLTWRLKKALTVCKEPLRLVVSCAWMVWWVMGP